MKTFQVTSYAALQAEYDRLYALDPRSFHGRIDAGPGAVAEVQVSGKQYRIEVVPPHKIATLRHG